MWKSRLFWKPVVFCLVGIAVVHLVLASVMIRWRQGQIQLAAFERIESLVRSHARRFLPLVETGDLEGLEQAVKLVRQDSDVRVTIISSDGTVLAETERPRAGMDSHDLRPEIRQAREEGVGRILRKSLTLEQGLAYVAVRFTRSDGTDLFIRMSESGDGIAQQQEFARQKAVDFLLMLAIVCIVAAMLIVARFARPLLRVMDETNELVTKHLGDDAVIFDKRDVGTISRMLGQLDEELASRFTQLESSSEQLDRILDGMAEGLIVVDHEQRIQLANKAAAGIFDIQMPEDLGRPVWELIRNRSIEKSIRKSVKKDRTYFRTVELRGTPPRHLAINTTPYPGEPTGGVIIVLHDISDLHRLENIRREFVANASHELKTPLASIQAYAETLNDGALADPEHSREFLARILEQSERLNLLIQDMLALAQVEAGDQSLDSVPVSIGELVEECFESQAAAAASKRIELRAEPPAMPVHAVADPEGVRQVLLNLVDNAIKYSNEEATVTVSWSEIEEMVEIEVRDTGIGIPADSLDRLFERFYRVDKARSRELGGTGLGLAIVKHLAQAFDGDVRVESTPGEGSSFYVRLPRSSPADSD